MSVDDEDATCARVVGGVCDFILVNSRDLLVIRTTNVLEICKH